MKNSPRNLEQAHFLSGWKEIANYLGKGVRTVQRYERHMGLPIRRPAGGSRGSVVATTAEIDAWVNASPIRNTYRLDRPKADSSVNMAAAITRGMAQMVQLREQMVLLREQMAVLRLELHNSVEMLHQTMFSLQGGLNFDPWPEPHHDTSLPWPDTPKGGLHLVGKNARPRVS